MNTKNRTLPFITGMVSAAIIFGSLGSLHAGEIPSQQAGWNKDNVDVVVDGDGNYESHIYDRVLPDGAAVKMSTLVAKDPPVGEQPGVKVINDDPNVKAGDPENCIMSTAFLEPSYTVQVTCSSGFQTHKRYKVQMLPSMVDGGTDSVDMVFNVTPTAEERPYRVFQKINNWTDSRLAGFVLEVGFGIGADFQKVSAAAAAAGLGTPHELSVDSASYFEANKRTNFAHGLFGPIESNHVEPGFFNATTRSGYYVTESGGDTITSDAGIFGTYENMLPNDGTGNTLFGPWLPGGDGSGALPAGGWLPTGVFWDDDNDPDTDDTLMAWWGYNPTLAAYGWMYGVAGGFAEVPAGTITTWAADPLYYTQPIDDLANLNLNYVVNIAAVTEANMIDHWKSLSGTTWDAGAGTASFTIRVTAVADAQGAPGYVANPAPPLSYASSAGTVSITPDPHLAGDTLTVTVADADLNANPAAAETVNVSLASSLGETENVLTLTETGVDRGVFKATINTAYGLVAGADNDGLSMNTSPGVVITVTYNDADDGTANPAVVTDTTTAAGGSTGVLTTTATIEPGDPITITVGDGDLNKQADVIEFTTVTAANGAETETVVLQETGVNTGTFSRTLATADADPGASGDNTLNVRVGDTVTVTYEDANNDAGDPATVTAQTVVVAAGFIPPPDGGGGGGGCSANDDCSNPTLPLLLGGVLLYGLVRWVRRTRLS